jgi:hypothetical protein
MPRIKMSNIDALPIGKSDVVYWDVGRPGFGVQKRFPGTGFWPMMNSFG